MIRNALTATAAIAFVGGIVAIGAGSVSTCACGGPKIDTVVVTESPAAPISGPTPSKAETVSTCGVRGRRVACGFVDNARALPTSSTGATTTADLV